MSKIVNRNLGKLVRIRSKKVTSKERPKLQWLQWVVEIINLAVGCFAIWFAYEGLQLTQTTINQTVAQYKRDSINSIETERAQKVRFDSVSNLLHQYDSLSTMQLEIAQQQLNESNEERRIRKLEQRPFLVVESLDIDTFLEKGDTYLSFVVKLKNNGIRQAEHFNGKIISKHNSNLQVAGYLNIEAVNPINSKEGREFLHSFKTHKNSTTRYIVEVSFSYIDPFNNNRHTQKFYFHTVYYNNKVICAELPPGRIAEIERIIKEKGYYDSENHN